MPAYRLLEDIVVPYMRATSEQRRISTQRTEVYCYRRLEAFFSEYWLCDDASQLTKKIVTKDAIRQYREKRKLVDGVKPVTIMRELALVSAAVNYFIHDTGGQLATNPFDHALIGKADRRTVKPRDWEEITPKEQAALVMACDSLTRDIFVFSLATGLRRGEILNLIWDQIDGDELHFQPEESKSGRHDMCMINDEAIDMLTRRKRHSVCEYVFHKGGRRVTVDHFHHRMWAPARKRAGLARHVQFHECRKTLGQRILDKTGNPVLAQYQLRHADLRTTQRIYAKKPKDLMRDAVNKSTTTGL